MLTRSSYAHRKPAPRKAAGPPKPIADDVTWTRTIEPRELYRVLYLDRNNQQSSRLITLTKLGHSGYHAYLGVLEEGKPKTFRADRLVEVVQVSAGHAPSIHAAPQYFTTLPNFPVDNAVYKVPAIAAHSTRTWSVDLSSYTCTCPEKRIRSAKGYKPGQLGYCCPHIARAILDHLPDEAPAWTDDLRAFLQDYGKMHLDNLIAC